VADCLHPCLVSSNPNPLPPNRRRPTRKDKAVAPQPAEQRPGWAQRLKQGLAKNPRPSWRPAVEPVRGRSARSDAELFEELETILITADIGVDATQHCSTPCQKTVRRENLTEASDLQAALKEALVDLLAPLQAPLDVTPHKPFILMLAGVNGAGKTTTIRQARQAVSGAGAVGAAGGRRHLPRRGARTVAVWGERNNVTVISQEKGDSAAVIFDAIQAAQARDIDVVLADTAAACRPNCI